MAKQLCDLCRNFEEEDMRHGVRLCKNCVDGYDQALSGDMAAATYFANPQNFPAASELARARVIDTVAGYVWRKQNPQGAAPVYGNPAVGNPAYGNPAYGAPIYGNPAYGVPPVPPMPQSQAAEFPPHKFYDLLQEQRDMIRTIKNCVVFFTVIFVLSMIITFLAALFAAI